MANVSGSTSSDYIHVFGDGLAVPPAYAESDDATDGIDTITMGQGGSDIVHAGGGGDTIVFIEDLDEFDTIDGGAGTDTLEIRGQVGVAFNADALVSVERLVLTYVPLPPDVAGFQSIVMHDANLASGLTMTIDASNLGSNVFLSFNGAAETNGRFSFSGSTGDDYVVAGQAGNVFSLGNGGNDTVIGGALYEDIFMGDSFNNGDRMVLGGGDALYLSGASYAAGLTLAADALTSRGSTLLLDKQFSYRLTTHDANVPAGEWLYVTMTGTTGLGFLDFDGSAEADGTLSVQGGAGNDTMRGGANPDYLFGAAGNDTYVDPLGDSIGEQPGNGTDTVQSGATFSILSLVNVENIRLTGGADVNAAGNAGGNRLLGNAGGNVLNGNGGADTMSGGAGNDIYYVDSASDQTLESAGQGTDLVSSSVSRTLSAHVENLNLSGVNAIDGNGNTSANIINGNKGNNILRGYEGADTLTGGAGNDILLGGTASDSLNPGSDAVRDIIRFSAVADSTGSQRDIVTGLDLTAEDRLDFTVIPTAIAFVGSGALNLATFNANLAAAVDGALAVNGAVLFDPTSGDMNVTGHLFVVVDANGDGVYRPNQDYVIQLVNSTGFLTLDDFI